MGTPTGGVSRLGVAICLSSRNLKDRSQRVTDLQEEWEEAAEFSVHLVPTQLLVTEWGMSHNFQAMPTLGQLTA